MLGRQGRVGGPRDEGAPPELAEVLARDALGTAASRYETEHLDRLIVSTDDEEIAQAAEAAGAEVPFLRPASLADDDTPTLPVVQHALGALASAGDHYDAVCLLQPTSPFRRVGLIDRCIDALDDRGDLDSVMTIKPMPPEHHPAWAYLRSADGTMQLAVGGIEPVARRQELPPAFCRDGSVYVSTARAIDGGSLYGTSVLGVEVDPAWVVNLDGEADWVVAEALVADVLAQRTADR